MNIENIDGPGIKINRGNYSKIKGCKIKKSQCGVQVISAQPHILMNEFVDNYESGIITEAKKGIRCDALISFNKIENNKQCGIFCTGENNHTRIEKNLKIAGNTLAGIKAADSASITIVNNNEISGNYGQGILLVESTYAHIEKNDILRNYKANIAYGGPSSSDTVILHNTIRESRAEGIFVIESGFSWIKRNNIIDNADGIIMFDSTPHVQGNIIEQNQRSGITCCGSSYPKLEGNEIFGNIQSGVNFRD